MEKYLGVFIGFIGCVLLFFSVIFLGNAEVKQWFPLFILTGLGLSFKGWKRYSGA